MRSEASIGTSLPRRAAALALALLAALQAGCASDRDKPSEAAYAEPPRAEMPALDFQPGRPLGRVAVVAVARLPDTLVGIARVKPRPVAHSGGTCGGGNGGSGSSGSKKDNCTGTSCALFYGAILAVGAAACAGKSGSTPDGAAPPPEPGKFSTPARLNAAILEEALRDQIVAAAKASGVKLSARAPENIPSGHRYSALASRGIDTVLEVELTQVLATSGDSSAPDHPEETNPALPLEMKAHVRLVRADDDALLYSGDYTYRGESLRYNDWMADQGKKLANAVQRGDQALARDISTSIFVRRSGT